MEIFESNYINVLIKVYKKTLMNSHKSIFKKFFVNDNEKEKRSNSSDFNPPKFHFDKKKLGVVISKNSRIKEPHNNLTEEDKVMKDIESAEIDDSELGDHLDDWNRTIDAPDTTMNTRIVDVLSKDTQKPKINTSSVNQVKNEYSAYRAIVQKNHQKYNLSNQLELFSESIQSQLRNCESRRYAMELLLLGIDEKIGKIYVVKYFLIIVYGCFRSGSSKF